MEITRFEGSVLQPKSAESVMSKEEEKAMSGKVRSTMLERRRYFVGLKAIGKGIYGWIWALKNYRIKFKF